MAETRFDPETEAIFQDLLEQAIKHPAFQPEALVASQERWGRDMEAFKRDSPSLLEQYPDQWVYFHEGAVRAVAPTREELRAKVEAQGMTWTKGLIRLLDTDPPVLIL